MSSSSGPLHVSKPEVFGQLDLSRHAVIEASAGTGKTYTIERIVLSLLIERSLTIDQILVLTFTEKAAAEMRQRIRKFLEKVLRGDEGRAIDGDAPSWRIDDAARRALRAALDDFDRSSIRTIHAFCQGILTELAFEGGRLLEQEAVDMSRGFERAFFRALRGKIATDEKARQSLETWLSRSGLSQMKSCLLEAARSPSNLPPADQGSGEGVLEVLAEDVERLFRDQDIESLLLAFTGFGKGRKSTAATHAAVIADQVKVALCPHLSETEGKKPTDKFQAALKYFAGKIDETPPATSEARETFDAFQGMITLLERKLPWRTALAQVLLPIVVEEYRAEKARQGQFDFQDMIAEVAGTVAREPEGPLVTTLRERYRHVLIDEFQDTDSLQWSLFKTVFFDSDQGHVLQVVGDPKQAIYGFRGADVATYLAARSLFEERGFPIVDLRANFRSDPSLLIALNRIFDQQGQPPFFSGAINYDKPSRPGAKAKHLTSGDRRLASCRLIECDGLSGGRDIDRALARFIPGEIQALCDNAELSARQVAPRIRVDDVLILTQTNAKSVEIANVLEAAGIPWDLPSRTERFETTEALEILDVLEAIADPADEAKRLRAYLGPYFGYRLRDLKALRDAQDRDLATLEAWRSLAGDRGLGALFTELSADCGMATRARFDESGAAGLHLRRQILETLQEEALVGRLDLPGTVELLRRFTRKEARPREDSANSCRRTRDGGAVRIMTMHSSKGLEAPVVFFYGVCNRKDLAASVHSVADRGQRHTFIASRGELGAERRAALERAEREESERLHYVALTRAEILLYLPWWSSEPQAGRFDIVAQRLLAMDARSMAMELPESFDIVSVHAHADLETPDAQPALDAWVLPDVPAPRSVLSARDWREETRRRHDQCHRGAPIESYSSLKRRTADEETMDTLALREPRTPDDGVAAASSPESAAELPGGRLTGLFLHALLEEVDYRHFAATPEDDVVGDPEIRRLGETLAGRFGVESLHVEAALRMVHRTLCMPIDLGSAGVLPALGDVENPRVELEFVAALRSDGSAHPEQAARSEILPADGYLKGFIDLVFVHEGRLYVLDWKSDVLERYDDETIDQRVRESYSLQVEVYGNAAAQILGLQSQEDFEQRFGGLIYVFLRGVDSNDGPGGIWFRRPSWEQVKDWPRRLGQLMFGERSTS